MKLICLPADVEATLYLIREELKSRKLFAALHKAGIDDCYFQPHLDSLILKHFGMENCSDQMFQVYMDILDKRSKKIEADNESIMRQAMKVYFELLAQKRSIKSAG